MKSNIRQVYNNLGEHYYNVRKGKEKGVSYFYNNLLEMPTTLKLLGSIKGKDILDLGCGPGLYAEILINKGAHVKGIDFSEKEISIAKKEVPKAEFTIGSIEKLPYKNSEFDIVLSTLVLEHLELWNKMLKEVNRVLKQNGIFVFSIHNPVVHKTMKVKWFFKKFRIIKDYFKESWIYEKWGEGNTIKHHHKTYGTVIKLLVNNGFEIIDYEDCKPAPSSKKVSPETYEKTINAPHFCVWKVRKK